MPDSIEDGMQKMNLPTALPQDLGKTRQSFILRLQNSQDRTVYEKSWEEFVLVYRPKMERWAMTMGLRSSTAKEVCQDLLGKLVEKLKGLAYDPEGSFRGWLHTATRNAVKDFMGKHGRVTTVDSEQLEEIVTEDDLVQQIDEFFHLELLEAAKELTRCKVCRTPAGKRNWEIFLLLERGERSRESIAEEFGVRRHAVDVANHRVLQILRTEFRRLDKGLL